MCSALGAHYTKAKVEVEIPVGTEARTCLLFCSVHLEIVPLFLPQAYAKVEVTKLLI